MDMNEKTISSFWKGENKSDQSGRTGSSLLQYTKSCVLLLAVNCIDSSEIKAKSLSSFGWNYCTFFFVLQWDTQPAGTYMHLDQLNHWIQMWITRSWMADYLYYSV